MQIED